MMIGGWEEVKSEDGGDVFGKIKEGDSDDEPLLAESANK